MTHLPLSLNSAAQACRRDKLSSATSKVTAEQVIDRRKMWKVKALPVTLERNIFFSILSTDLLDTKMSVHLFAHKTVMRDRKLLLKAVLCCLNSRQQLSKEHWIELLVYNVLHASLYHVFLI